MKVGFNKVPKRGCMGHDKPKYSFTKSGKIKVIFKVLMGCHTHLSLLLFMSPAVA